MRFLCTFLLFIPIFWIHAQHDVFPKDFDTLTFNAINFSFPEGVFERSYIIEITDITNKSTHVYTSETNQKIIGQFIFNTDYKWRYSAANDRGTAKDWSPYFHFRVEIPARIHAEHYRFSRHQISRGKTSPAIFLMDYAECAVNRAGDFIFFIPEVKGFDTIRRIRDLDMTPEGTFTALIDSIPCEFDLMGNVIWKAPDSGILNNESRENYHHEFTKLDNGNYLMLGTDNEKVEIGGELFDVAFDTVLEFDKEGKLVWSWNSKDYFGFEFLDFLRIHNERRGGKRIGLHANACSQDAENVYIGFRDISRILVINKKSKDVIASYGGYGPSDEIHGATAFFRRQHDVELLKDGSIAVLNNDSIMDPNVVSSLVIFSKINSNVKTSSKLMDFKFDFDTLTNGKSPKTGNLQELDNGNLFVNMGSINRCFEVTRDGKVLWDLFFKKYDTNHRMELPFPQYRIHEYSSLYRYEFNANVSSIKQLKEFKEVGITIYNLGSEDDIYIVEKVNARGKKEIIAELELSTNEKISVDLRVSEGEKSHVVIQSKSSHKSKWLTVN